MNSYDSYTITCNRVNLTGTDIQKTYCTKYKVKSSTCTGSHAYYCTGNLKNDNWFSKHFRQKLSSSEHQDFKIFWGAGPQSPLAACASGVQGIHHWFKNIPFLHFQKVRQSAKSLCCNSQISWSPQFLIVFGLYFFQDGLTPLHCASRDGHDTVVEYLVNKKASIIARTKVCRILIGCSNCRSSSEVKEWHWPFT